MKTHRWMLRSRQIAEVVVAEDQWGAWNTLRNRPVEDFGLLVTAEPDENDDPIPVHTATLMRKWGRTAEADAFDDRARELGLL